MPKDQETDESGSFDSVNDKATGGASKGGRWMNGEGTMMRTHTDHRAQEEMNEMARLDRLRHILEILDDCPHFDFYAHEHPEDRQQFHVRG